MVTVEESLHKYDRYKIASLLAASRSPSNDVTADPDTPHIHLMANPPTGQLTTQPTQMSTHISISETKFSLGNRDECVYNQ